MELHKEKERELGIQAEYNEMIIPEGLCDLFVCIHL